MLQIADIREQLEHAKDTTDATFEEADAPVSGPMLLDGGQATFDIPTVLLDVPPKDAVDKLIFRYFNSAENSIGKIRRTKYHTLMLITL